MQVSESVRIERTGATRILNSKEYSKSMSIDVQEEETLGDSNRQSEDDDDDEVFRDEEEDEVFRFRKRMRF